MSVYDRGSSYYYRFWKGGRLHERGGYPTRKAAQDAEWERRQEVRALRPRDAARPPKRLHEAVQEYLTKVVARHRNAVGERYTFRLVLERAPMSARRGRSSSCTRARWRSPRRTARS